MVFFRALTAVMPVLGVLATGCSGADGGFEADEALDLDDVLYSTMTGPGGSGGQNHLPPELLHPNKGALYTSTKTNLATFDAVGSKWRVVDNPSNIALFGSAAGREVMKYAARCALPFGQTVWDDSLGVDVSYPGQGLLTTTTGWKTSGLTTAAAEDLMACMAAHLNPYGQIVPINLSGMHVTNAPGFDASPYEWEEALWTAIIVTSPFGMPSIVIHVWPLPDLEACALDYVEGLTSRVCPSGGAGGCGLSVRTDRPTACQEYLSGWKCDGRPAIRTKLKVGDVPRMYDGCLP